MKKTKKQMPWREMLRLNNRALKLFYKRYPQMILSRLISVVWNSLTPYVSIYLSALVIDELAGSRNVERLQLLVLITLASAAVIALGTALLKKWTEAQSAGGACRARRTAEAVRRTAAGDRAAGAFMPCRRRSLLPPVPGIGGGRSASAVAAAGAGRDGAGSAGPARGK